MTTGCTYQDIADYRFTRGGTVQVWAARSDGTAFENGTQWHGNFAPSPEVPLPSAHR